VCRSGGLPAPSYKAVWRRVNSIDPALMVKAREGAKAARDKFKSVGAGLRPTRALELAQIDHTLADIIVVDELERRPIGRPWLTLVIDVATCRSRELAILRISRSPPVHSRHRRQLVLARGCLRRPSSRVRSRNALLDHHAVAP
jgi:hypothetical protein